MVERRQAERPTAASPIVRAMTRRLLRHTGFAVMSAVALVLAHNLVFLVGYGPGYASALSRTGHDEAWASAVRVVLGLGAMLLVIAAWRLHRLGLLARAGGAARPAQDRGFLGHLLQLWPRLALVTPVLFVLQENLERHAIGQPMPGVGVLVSSEYPSAIVVFAAVTFAIAVVGSLVRWRRDVLLARIAAARPRWLRATAPSLRRTLESLVAPRASLVGRRLAVRAPPAPVQRPVGSTAGSR
jgi:hypothetical protein